MLVMNLVYWAEYSYIECTLYLAATKYFFFSGKFLQQIHITTTKDSGYECQHWNSAWHVTRSCKVVLKRLQGPITRGK
jgi:hypothetical protein